MNIAIFGGSGQLGTMLTLKAEKEGHTVYSFSSKDCDIIEALDVNACIGASNGTNLDVIINCAAMHDLKECERNPQEAFDVNAIGARNVAIASNNVDALNVYISTNYVLEHGEEAPMNIYGVSKLAGEYITKTYSKRGIVIRTAALYGPFPCSRKSGNFVDNLLDRIKDGETDFTMVSDQYVNLSRTDCVSNLILTYILENLETVHSSRYTYTLSAVNVGENSWYEYAKIICNYMSNVMKKPIKVHPSVTDNSLFPKRPLMAPLYVWGKYSNITMHSKQALIEYVAARYNEGKWVDPIDVVQKL